MKIRTGKLVDGEVVHTLRTKIWTAAHWNLSGKSLAQELEDRAFAAAGITPSARYKAEATVYGTGGDKPAEEWTFAVQIYRRDWVEVEK